MVARKRSSTQSTAITSPEAEDQTDGPVPGPQSHTGIVYSVVRTVESIFLSIFVFRR